MPAYTQIEAYARCGRDTLPQFLARCAAVLREIGADQVRVGEWLAAVTWDEEEGCVTAGYDADWFDVTAGEVTFNLWPVIPSWPNAAYPESSPGWLGFELNFDTEELDVPEDPGVYRTEVGAGLWWMMTVMAKYFPESGVFLTDEVGEGVSFEGVLENDPQKVCAYDLAIFPPGLAECVEGVPSAFARLELGEVGVAVAARRRWHELPWGALG